jgi:hypothetical protein
MVAGAVSVALLAVFTIVAALVMLKDQGRLRSPVAWWRLGRWSLSLAFEVLPDLAASASATHHPTDFTDPVLLTTWLRHFDPDTATVPVLGVPGAGPRLSRPA